MEGKCIIFSAPSGSGKTTIVHHLLQCNLNLAFSVSASSRDQRKDEVHGEDYYFYTPQKFRELIKADAFVEWEEVYTEQYYGTLKSEIERIWSLGKHVIFDVDVVGGLNLKKAFGDKALAVFVQAPSVDHLEARLRQRATETEETLARRLGKAAKEMAYAPQFDCVVVNDALENAFEEAEQVVGKFLNVTPISNPR